jgi:hypothetical protein
MYQAGNERVRNSIRLYVFKVRFGGEAEGRALKSQPRDSRSNRRLHEELRQGSE